tara:strand:- start:43 stop:801 length:759 start_codon:yes stop_codon:yes gene_type:complete
MTTKLRAASFQDGAVTSAKIAADAVTAAKIPANAIGSSELDLTASYAFTGTVSGDNNHLVKVASSSSSSGVADVAFDNAITATYNDYLLMGSVVGTDGANFSVDIYFIDGTSGVEGAVGSGNTGFAFYQGQMINRAASSSYQGAVLNGDNSYLRLPVSGDVYGGGILTFKVHFHNLFTGVHVGLTNISTRNIRNGSYEWAAQTTNASDHHGGVGWFRADNPNNNRDSIDGIKINSGNNNFVKHNMALYGYVK